jgi:hypothetical protein
MSLFDFDFRNYNANIRAQRLALGLSKAETRWHISEWDVLKKAYIEIP